MAAAADWLLTFDVLVYLVGVRGELTSEAELSLAAARCAEATSSKASEHSAGATLNLLGEVSSIEGLKDRVFMWSLSSSRLALP